MMKIRKHLYKIVVSLGLLFGLSGCIMNTFSYTHITIDEMTENEYEVFKKDFISFAQTINYSCKNVSNYNFLDNISLDMRCKYDLKKYDYSLIC